MKQIDRMPRKGEHIIFNSKGMFPESDNIEYVVIEKFKNYDEILNIQNIKTESRTQVIVKFKEGYNKYLYFL